MESNKESKLVSRDCYLPVACRRARNATPSLFRGLGDIFRKTPPLFI